MQDDDIKSPTGGGDATAAPGAEPAPRPRSTNATGRKRRRDTHPNAPSELDCFQAYLELGEERTLPLLAQVLFDRYGEAAPSVPTLKRMSCGNWRGGRARTAWAERLKEHDRKVKEEVERLLVKSQAKRQFDEIAALKSVIEKSLTIAETVLAGGSHDPETGRRITGLALDGSVKEITELLRTAVEASKHAQLLTGGATSRAETINRELRDDLTDEEIVRLYSQYAQRPGAADATKH